jgi:hypothetical protein
MKNEYRGTLRKLTPGTTYSKMQKLVALNTPPEDMCRRINYHNLDRIYQLIHLLPERKVFYQCVEEINREIGSTKKDVNAEYSWERLQQEEHLEPIPYNNISVHFDWLKLPKHLIPEMMSLGTYLAGKRKDWKGLARRLMHCKRKRMQIETLVSLLNDYTRLDETTRPIKIADLCGGRGDLSLMLAYLYPNCQVTIMDRNKLGLYQAQYRARMLGLTNCAVREMDLFEYQCSEHFDIVIGLHACGSLTDAIIEKFTPHTDYLFIATCCFGKMKIPSEYSGIADSDVGVCNTAMSRLAKMVINSKRGVDHENFQIIEIRQECFSSKNQILFIDNS